MQRSIQNPMPEALAPRQRAAAQEVARGLAAAGHRAWIVGGCVRDLALGRSPKDVDLASAALPEEIESLFARTIGVGKAFGTMVVVTAQGEVELTTFRAERGYSDGRRPDEVSYGASLEQDAQRRDFTCNAMYLDPLNAELRDPEGGMQHLRQGLLVCVGEARERFDEDGLRLLRLARFAAALDLEVRPETLDAARGCRERIQAVSAERKLSELKRIADLDGAAKAILLLAEIDVLSLILPVTDVDLEALGRLPARPGAGLLLGTLLGSLAQDDPKRALSAIAALKPARVLVKELEDAWLILHALQEALQEEGRLVQRIMRYRHPGWEHGLELWRAFHALGQPQQALRLARWCEERRDLGELGLRPELWLKSSDLERAGVSRGPRFGELLRRAEELQLDGELCDREAALEWLARQA